ncbi:6-phosphogluconolactonase [Nitriliruptoraceae bacterium ZYF776]|nr:6-phosphogluconolactonase [Profundirhabdus halotolerans]
MKVVAVRSAEDLARRGAEVLAEALHAALGSRDRVSFGVSGGRTPLTVFARLAALDLDWERVAVLQVDERLAAEGSPERNLSGLAATLGRTRAHLHPVPVAPGVPRDEVARRYAQVVTEVAGDPPVLDVVHLGLGADGHTASLFPGDPAALEVDAPVVATGAGPGPDRVSLTLPVLAAARRVVWIVGGQDKAEALVALRAGDGSIPAGRVPQGRAVLVADAAALGG